MQKTDDTGMPTPELKAIIFGEVLRIIATSPGPVTASKVHLSMLENLGIEEELGGFYLAAFILARSGLVKINSPSGHQLSIAAGTELVAAPDLIRHIWDDPMPFEVNVD